MAKYSSTLFITIKKNKIKHSNQNIASNKIIYNTHTRSSITENPKEKKFRNDMHFVTLKTGPHDYLSKIERVYSTFNSETINRSSLTSRV